MSESQKSEKSTQSTDRLPNSANPDKSKKSVEQSQKLAEEMKKSKEDKLKYTQVCMFWLKNLWRKGEDWEFLHSFEPDKIPIWKNFLAGTWANRNCMFTHTLNSKSLRKWKYYEKGFCINGRNCQGFHEQKILCPDYQEGFCPLGPKCNNYHLKMLVNPLDDCLQKLVAQMFTKKKQTKDQDDKICHKCGKRGHTSDFCNNKKISHKELINILKNDKEYMEKAKTIVCYRCWEVGHYPIMCPKPQGASAPKKLPERNIDSYQSENIKKRDAKSNEKSLELENEDQFELLQLDKMFPLLVDSKE